MKKLKFTLASAILLILSSCQSMGGLGNLGNLGGLGGLATPGANGEQSVLESVLGTLLGNAVPLTEANIRGTWQYASPDVRFESENALAQAGGMVAAQQAESKLAEVYSKIGIKAGACSFTFAENGQCTITVGGRSLGGSYTINPQTHDIAITTGMGLVNLNGKIYYTGKTLTVLFDAQKLLQVVQTIASITGQGNSSLGALSSLASQYRGMMLGMNLQK